MDNNDPGHAGWLDMLGRVRAYGPSTRPPTLFDL